MMTDFLQAVRFLTVLPLPWKIKEGNLARSMFFFPLVGFLIGLASLLLAQVLSLHVFVRLHALALVTFPVFLSGALHLDGFADFCDGFFGARRKEDVLRIMRDSRIGVWGALGVCLLLFWKWELLASLPGRSGALLLALTASRWTPVALAYFLPYAGNGPGLGESVAKKVTARELAGASVFLVLAVFLFKGTGLICLLALPPLVAGLAFLFKKRVGGITGDLLGAASEATECYILFILFLVRSGGFQ